MQAAGAKKSLGRGSAATTKTFAAQSVSRPAAAAF